MTIKKIVWLGPERQLPNIGYAIPGSEHFCEKPIADSYIAQGLAAAGDKEAKVNTNSKKEVK